MSKSKPALRIDLIEPIVEHGSGSKKDNMLVANVTKIALNRVAWRKQIYAAGVICFHGIFCMITARNKLISAI